MRASVYIHLPFCASKCAYCDFESYAGRLNRADEYIARLIDEAGSYGSISVPTVYLGGGTPSLLEAEQLARLLGGVLERLPAERGAEISMEANPGTLTPGKLRAAAQAGVNRLSIGVQAAQGRLLRLLNRIHDFDAARDSVKAAQDAGISDISCDVMYALPAQSADDLLETVERINELGVTHMSCYSLTLEKGTPLYEKVRAGELALPDENAACDMHNALLARLGALGFKRYEISNYAKPGHECRHNMVYWTGGDYLGLGCAAHSYMNGERYCNPSFDMYMAGKTHVESIYIDERGRLEEKLMLATRLTRGAALDEFTPEVASRLITEALKPEFAGLISAEGGRLRFTDAGLMLHSALVFRLIEALT